MEGVVKLPKHINLTIEHNPHATCYETVAAHFSHTQEPGNELYDFSDKEDEQKCIDQNDFWTCRWYPNTPVGFILLAASSYEKLMALVAQHTTKSLIQYLDEEAKKK